MAHLGADLSRMLQQLGPREPDEAPRLSLPQLRVSNQKQQLLPVQQPQPMQNRIPVLRQPNGADVAASSHRILLRQSMQTQLPGTSPAAEAPASEHSKEGSIVMLPCHDSVGALSAPLQKPVFAKHKRVGPQLPSKTPAGSKAGPSGAKVGSTAEHSTCRVCPIPNSRNLTPVH